MWYIGQEIVCIKTHSSKKVIKDNIYTIHSLRQSCCEVIIDVGIKDNLPLSECWKCYKTENANGIFWISETLFKPLDEIADISELTKILSKPVEELFTV